MKRISGKGGILTRHVTRKPQSLWCYDGMAETCGRPDQFNHLVPFKASVWVSVTYEGACQNFG